MSLELIVLARPDRPYRVTIQESIFELEPEMRLQIFCDLDAKPNIYQLLTQRRHRYPHPVVFHWYSGTLKTLETVVQAGHFFSINPAMVRSVKGRDAIAQIPRERILTESDGPFINMGSRTIEPTDVQAVEEALGVMWGVSTVSARNIVQMNFQELIMPLRRPANVRSAK
jgi:TatD DNase family protein